MYGNLVDFKAMLGITDSTRDTALTFALTVSSEQIDNLCGRGASAFAAAGGSTTRVIHTPTASYIGQPDSFYIGADLVIPGVGDVTGMVVEQGGPSTYATLDPTTYTTGPDNAIVNGQPVTQLRNLYNPWTLYPYIRVTAKFGWPGGASPASVIQAAYLQASRIYRRKDSPEGVIGSSEWGGIRVSRADPDVMALLSTYMLPGFA